MKKYFGTDGVRGKANSLLITPEGAISLGKTLGYYIIEKELPKIAIIGKDTRISGDFLENAISSGLSSLGIEVWKLGIITTPGIAYLSHSLDIGAGVVISASHNPYYDNGIKFFSHTGFKFEDKVEEYLEDVMDKNIYNEFLPHEKGIGRIYYRPELVNKYENFLKSHYNGKPLDLKVVIDTANGATYKIAKNIFSPILNTIVINNSPNGININYQCGSTHIENLAKKVLEEHADFGFAFDGDGDRVIFVNEKGEEVDGDALLYFFAKNRKDKNIVVTFMSNLGLDFVLKKEGIKVIRTAHVGDKYVLLEMIKKNIKLGGEQSGHIVFLDNESTGDGMFTALAFLKYIDKNKMPLSETLKEFKKFPQKLVNINLKNKDVLYDNPQIKEVINRFKDKLDGEGDIIVRPSGTEPLVRVMVQAKEEKIVTDIVNQIKIIIEESIL